MRLIQDQQKRTLYVFSFAAKIVAVVGVGGAPQRAVTVAWGRCPIVIDCDAGKYIAVDGRVDAVV